LELTFFDPIGSDFIRGATNNSDYTESNSGDVDIEIQKSTDI
jgi:hypothetical protein